MSRWRAFDFPLVRPCTILFTTNEDHFFLDDAATCPCLSAAHYVYPIRVRFPDIVTGNMDWMLAGFISIIKPKDPGDAEKVRVRMLRNEVLQRCLAVLLYDIIAARETGVLWCLPGKGPVWVVPRVVLYSADQPEERHLLGLKLSGCKDQ